MRTTRAPCDAHADTGANLAIPCRNTRSNQFRWFDCRHPPWVWWIKTAERATPLTRHRQEPLLAVGGA
jgi:hypothetical protein